MRRNHGEERRRQEEEKEEKEPKPTGGSILHRYTEMITQDISTTYLQYDQRDLGLHICAGCAAKHIPQIIHYKVSTAQYRTVL